MRPAHVFPAPRISGYRIMEPLGSGGMSSVWRAIHMSTGREVAIKVLDTAADAHATALSRFHREIRVMAMLRHPNIARLHSSGVCGHIHFYAMELISGLPLDQYVRQRSLSHPQVLSLFASICRVVDYAHRRGVIHGDLKPSNILVDAQGQPHLLDFGLADASASGESRILADGEVAGTLEFISPEQAAGSGRPLDARCDVYSLGAVLFLLLTGQGAHDTHSSHAQALYRIARQRPRHVREIDPGISAKLDAVLIKAMQTDPARRHASAANLADEVDGCCARKAPGGLTRALRNHIAGKIAPSPEKNRILILAATASLAHLRLLWQG